MYALNEFVIKNRLHWKKFVGVCTDSARDTTGKHSGVVAQIKKVTPHPMFVHCSLHGQALVVKCLADLKTVLRGTIKIFNHIKSKEANSKLFALLCHEMGYRTQIQAFLR